MGTHPERHRAESPAVEDDLRDAEQLVEDFHAACTRLREALKSDSVQVRRHADLADPQLPVVDERRRRGLGSRRALVGLSEVLQRERGAQAEGCGEGRGVSGRLGKGLESPIRLIRRGRPSGMRG